LASLVLFAVLCNAPVHAEEKIGLVLGGGGARGAAHIGVLKILEREHIPIHAIAGTSVGSVIGGMYAAGYSPEEIEIIIGSIDWVDIFRDSTSRPDRPMRQKETDLGGMWNFELGIVKGELAIPTAFVQGQKLDLFLRKLFLAHSNLKSFDDLPIPFRCVATDIGTVRPVVFDSGDLEVAIRASMAVPAVFGPVQHNGKMLVDGGIVNNIPIDVARKMGVDRLIVVDVGEPMAPPETVNTTLEVLTQMVSGLMRDRTEQSLATLTPDDVLLRPEITTVSSADFLQSMEGVKHGTEAAEAQIERLRKWSKPEPEYLAWRAAQRQRAVANTQISFVHVEEKHSRTAGFVSDRITAEPNQPLDLKTLEKDISGAFGRGTYDSIRYQLVTDDQGRTGLEVLPVDKSLGRVLFRAGMQINDDFNGRDDYQLSIEGRYTGITEKGAELRAFVGLGRVTGITTDFYLPFGARGDWFFDPAVEFVAVNQPLVVDDLTVAEYRVDSWLSNLRVGYDFTDQLRFATGLIRGRDHASLLTGAPPYPPTGNADIGGINATLLWDSLDSVGFPRRGLRAELSYSAFDTHLGSDESGNLLRLAIDKPMSSGANTLVLGARASISKDRINAYQTLAPLGGLTYLSGLGPHELLGEQQLLVRAIFYHRLNTEVALVSVPLYMAGSLEGGNVWDTFEQVKLNDLIGASSIFFGVDLPLGPLQIGYGRTFDGRDSFYLTFSSFVLPRYR
jgi:NTE family protein